MMDQQVEALLAARKARELGQYTDADTNTDSGDAASRQLPLQNSDYKVDNQIWLLEHPPLYTAGSSARAEELLNPGDLPVYPSGRGGKYTWHGPGQRIAYLLLDLKDLQGGQPDLKAFVHLLEGWVIDALRLLGVDGYRRDGQIGVWVDKPSPTGAIQAAKIAAIGVRVRQWVSSHGIALNVHNNLLPYQGIVPCGIHSAGVTSLHDLGVMVGMDTVDGALKAAWPLT
ncbi:MAG: lipoyl(octanoyl) transferase LipB [Alphaproteobacteria bacterium]|nr:lipoyl(octanoyl) transferase LipB [Alphaproteobacteria bacterium]